MQYIYNMAISSVQQPLIGFLQTGAEEPNTRWLGTPVLENVWPIPDVARLFRLENLIEVIG